MLNSLQKLTSPCETPISTFTPEIPILNYLHRQDNSSSQIHFINKNPTYSEIDDSDNYLLSPESTFEGQSLSVIPSSKSSARKHACKKINSSISSEIKTRKGNTEIFPKEARKPTEVSSFSTHKPKAQSLGDLISSGIIPVGSIAYCFDCKAKVAPNGHLVDEIDLQEYADPSDWATYVALVVEDRYLPRQNSLKVVKIGGKTLEDLYQSLYTSQSYINNSPSMSMSKSVAFFSPTSIVKFSASGLSPDQQKFLELHSNNVLQYSINLSSKPDILGSTYLLVDTDSNGRCRRTLKCLFARMLRIPIVSFQCILPLINQMLGILDSVNEGHWRTMTQYLVLQDLQGRTFNPDINKKLFSGLTIAFNDFLKADCNFLSYAVLKKLFSYGGCALFDSKSSNLISLNRIHSSLLTNEVSPNVLLVVVDINSSFNPSRVKVPKINPLESPFKGYTIRSSAWILDCISQNTLEHGDPFNIMTTLQASKR